MSFEHPIALWGLLLVPLLALLQWRAARRADQAINRLVGARTHHALLAQRRAGARRLGAVLRLGALALLVLGAAAPQWGREAVRRSSQGADLVFLVDVSASMDSRDVAPSRLEEARREALALTERLEGSRIGVVAFAGDAVRLCPLTLDRPAVRLTLEALDSRTVSEPGSDLGRALRTALRLLPRGGRGTQAFVLWTDGEDLEGGARDAMEEVRDAGVRVFCVGVGTVAGDVVPVLDEQGRAVDIKRDERGMAVRSRLDERLLAELGRTTRGGYFTASSPGGELPRLVVALGGVARAPQGARLVERPVARFGWFALAAALLLVAELARPRQRMTAAAARPGLRLAAAIAIIASLPGAARAQSDWARGDAAWRAGRWAQAESLYVRRAGGRPPDALAGDLATARARVGKRDTAMAALSRLAADSGPAGRTAGYNLGTLHAEARDLDRALAELRRALERNPQDADARWNYELARRWKREQESAGGGPSPPRQQPPQPQPSPGAGTSDPQSDPEQGTKPQGPGPSPTPPPEPPPGPAGSRMTRAQADQLLGSLQELERLERQRRKRQGPARERAGKDW